MSKIATDTAHSQPNRKPRSRFSTILNNAIIDGLTVLPGLLGEKHPCVNWTEFQDTPPTDEHYEKWLRQFAKGNGFYLLGATYGRFVVDADTFEANEELAKRVEVETQMLRSARGPHYHFQWPGFHVFNSTSELGKGLDVRGQGGVAAAAGSLHVNGKHSYHWVPGHSPDDVELAPAPTWILDFLREQSERKQRAASAPTVQARPFEGSVNKWARAAIDGELDRLRNAQKTIRNNTLASVSFKLGQLAAGGEADAMELLNSLYQIADAWPEVPKSRRTIQHCFEAGHGHPRRRPERPQITNQQARQKETAPSVDETIEAADSVAATDRPIFAARNPFMLARAFIDQHYTTDGKRTLHYWNDSFLEWTGSYYSEISDGEIKSAVGNFLDKEVTLINKDGDPVAPTTWHTTNVVAMLGHEVQLSSKSIKPPIWLGENPGYPTEHLIALRNGLFDLTTAALDDPDPRFFNLNGIAASYDGTAECPNWLKFLAEVFPDDQESIDCLQEMFGYLLEVDNSLQKIFVLIGEKRSGKGTIKKVLDVLLGSAAISTSLTDLGGAFGLEPLIGHSVAIVPDARLGTHADPNAIVERLLTISGADNPSVPRKNKTNFKGPFAPRFVLLMNQWIPVLDTSGALATRLIPLRFLVSFEGREDKDLFVRDLAPEIDGIFRWAWRGWMNLYHRGDNQPPHFTVPDTASGLLASIVEQTNPLFDFFDDEGVEFGPRFWCFKKGVDGLYERYEGWADAKKKRHPMTYARFYALLNAVPGVNTEWRYDEETKKVRDRNGKPADRRVLGLRLKGSNNEI